jgi:hypothetical protein
MTDITERKWMEAALQESERKYRNIVETAIEGVMAYDKNWRITYANKKNVQSCIIPLTLHFKFSRGQQISGSPYETLAGPYRFHDVFCPEFKGAAIFLYQLPD